MDSSALHPSSITAVILNYNNAEDTVACLRALHTMPDGPYRVIVVDNGSQDMSSARILEEWGRFCSPVKLSPPGADHSLLPAAVLLTLNENNGYAAGNNAAIRLAMRDPACRAVWILNNDTIPQPVALDALCQRLNNLPNAGMSGSTLVYAHAPEYVQCAAGGSFNKFLGIVSAVHGGALLRTVLALAPESVEKRLGYICGASLLIRRETLEAIGLFAEEYFLYYEDTEFCLRVQKAGYKLAWARNSVVLHREGSTTGSASEIAGRSFNRTRMADYLALRNRIYIVRKYFPLCLPLAIAGYAVAMVNRVKRGQTQNIPLVLKALWDGLNRKMGKPRLSEEST